MDLLNHALDALLRWPVPIQRSIKQGPFTPAEVQQLASLSRQLESGAALAQAFGFARAEAALDAFNVSGSAVVLLDRCGEILRLSMLNSAFSIRSQSAWKAVDARKKLLVDTFSLMPRAFFRTFVPF